jgi:hypothetical protein
MSALLALVLKPLMPVLLTPLVYYAMVGLKKSRTWVGAQNEWTQRGIVVAISALFAAASKFVPGVADAMPCVAAMSCSLADVTPEVVKVLGTAGLAFLIHFNRKLPV